MWPKVFVKPSESVLELTSLGVLQLEGDGHGRGDDVAAAQGQEQQRQGGNLPTYLVNVHQLEINFVVKLWNDQNLYPTCNVSESVEAALLIDELQVLEDGHVHVEHYELDQQHSAHQAQDEVVSSPPALKK